MSLANQARDNTNKAFVATQNWNTNPADIRMPDSVNTKRPKLSNRQITRRYLESVADNQDIDINKKSGVAASNNNHQASSEKPTEMQRDFLKRSAACDLAVRDKAEYPPDHFMNNIAKRSNCKNLYFDEYKKYQESISDLLSYEVIGHSEPECICMDKLPEFMLTQDVAAKNAIEPSLSFYPKQMLDYIGIQRLRLSTLPCFGLDQCPEPESNVEEILTQIKNTTFTQPATRILLEQEYLDVYLAMQKIYQSNSPFKITYIRVNDKPKNHDNSPPLLSVEESIGLGTGLSIIGLLGLIGGGIGIILNYKKDENWDEKAATHAMKIIDIYKNNGVDVSVEVYSEKKLLRSYKLPKSRKIKTVTTATAIPEKIIPEPDAGIRVGSKSHQKSSQMRASTRAKNIEKKYDTSIEMIYPNSESDSDSA
jgi:hypothetical protein